jgi:hypothetical protein
VQPTMRRMEERANAWRFEAPLTAQLTLSVIEQFE